jgi:hypothetical protein
MKQSAFVRKGWLAPAILFPVFLVAMFVVYALLKASTYIRGCFGIAEASAG